MFYLPPIHLSPDQKLLLLLFYDKEAIEQVEIEQRISLFE